ncbi:MAG TPA: hypothetical protein PK808_00090, partial [Polymorphobacter sp.]|nr:hypothetical protein [Polymorphobacter sp.]
MSDDKAKEFSDQEALRFHATGRPGKIEIIASKPMATQRDLSLAYSPGVAVPVLAIAKDPDAAYDYTIKGNLVAVISNGTAILGLTTNTGFLRALVASDEFRDAAIDTAWLDRTTVPEPDRDRPRVLAAWAGARLAAGTDRGHPFQADGWRSGGDPAPIVVELDRPVVVDVTRGRVDDHDVRELAGPAGTLSLE